MASLMNGAEILLECLARKASTASSAIPAASPCRSTTHLRPPHPARAVRHEENACFAAEGYARATGKVGVCCATSGPGATNLVTGLVDAMMDSIPIVAITGQVSTKLIGSDAFQEADTFGITRSCTKHNYLVKNIAGPAAGRSRGFLHRRQRPARSRAGRHPQGCFHRRRPLRPGHIASTCPATRSSPKATPGQIRRAAQLMWEAERPLVYAGGGIVRGGRRPPSCASSSRLLDVPAVCTLMGLGGLSASHPNFVSMPGMHGSYAANMGMTDCDLLIALGVRFDDRVTGQLAAFAPHAQVIHVDIDPAEIGKNRGPDVAIVGDVKRVLRKIEQVLVKELAPEH